MFNSSSVLYFSPSHFRLLIGIKQNYKSAIYISNASKDYRTMCNPDASKDIKIIQCATKITQTVLCIFVQCATQMPKTILHIITKCATQMPQIKLWSRNVQPRCLNRFYNHTMCNPGASTDIIITQCSTQMPQKIL